MIGLAVALVGLQALIVLVLLRVVRSFRAFTDAHERAARQLVVTEQSNVALHAAMLRLLEALHRMPLVHKEVA